MRRSSIVVTGATGFVGSRVVSHLLGEGRRVIAPLRDPSRAPPGTTGVKWDLESGDLDPSMLGEAEAILHTAAFIPPDYADPSQAEMCFRTNALGSLRLIQDTIAAGLDTFIQLSTGNLYRNPAEPAFEGDPLYPGPRAPFYLTSKLAQEVFTEAAARGSELRLVTLRPSAIYGPGMGPAGLVPEFAARLLADETVEVVDGGRHGVDLVYVDDVVTALLAALDHNVHGSFNIGSGVRTTTLEVAQHLVAECQGDESLIYVAPATGEVATGFAALDVTRAKDELGLAPTPPATGLARYVTHLRGTA